MDSLVMSSLSVSGNVRGKPKVYQTDKVVLKDLPEYHAKYTMGYGAYGVCVYSIQVNFISVALLTVDIVTKQIHSM